MKKKSPDSKSKRNEPAGCPLGRRQFLARLGLAGGTAMALNTGVFRWSTRSVMGMPKVPGDGPEKPRIMVGFARPDFNRYNLWPGAGFPLDENQKLFTDIIEKAADELGVTLLIEREPLKDNAAMDAFLEKWGGEADGALVTQMGREQRRAAVGHFLDARPEGLPAVIFGPQGTRTWRIEERPGSFIGTTDNPQWLATALRMLKARWQMANTRLAVIAGDQEREERLMPLGTIRHDMPSQWIRDAMHAAEGSEEAREIAARYIENAADIVEPSETDILHAARNYVANRMLMEETGAHAVTTDCLTLVREGDGSLVQCLAFCQLLDEGTCGGCEADVYPALTCLLSSYLLNRPGFMSNPVIHTATNEYIGTHCQTPTRMAGFDAPAHPFRIRPHHETQQGVTLQVDYTENQPATLWRFIASDSLRVGTGTITRNARPEHHEDGIGGCQNGYAMQVDGVDDARLMAIYSHPVLSYGKHAVTIAAWCQLAGIEVVKGWV